WSIKKNGRQPVLERVEKVRHASQKCKHFFEGMQPAACTLGSKGDPRPHWLAEMCFFLCACPRKKRDSNLFSHLRMGKLCRGLLPMQKRSYFCIDNMFFDIKKNGPRPVLFVY